MMVLQQLFRNFYWEQNILQFLFAKLFLFSSSTAAKQERGIPFNIKFKTAAAAVADPCALVKQVKEICFDALKCMQISLK